MAEQNIASAVGFDVKCGSKEVEPDHLVSFSIELDLGQPDMCMISIRNETHQYSGSVKLGDPVEIKAGDDKTTIFSGKVAGVEPSFKANGENTVTVRAFNKLHQLVQGRKSQTFVDQSDQQIAQKIAKDNGLKPVCGNDPKITHKHVYQHNQTDLEFLRVRAARIGFEVWVEGDELHFEQPKSDVDSGIKLRYGDAGTSKDEGAVFLKYFAPRMSSSGVVNKVTVRGWNPETKKEIIGEATASNSKLGKKNASAAAGSPPETFSVDQPVFSVEEANAIAKAKLRESMMSFMTGEAECRGSPEIKPGIVVSIEVNPDDANDRFNGKYLVTGASHRYSNPSRGGEGGLVTRLRLCRDAEGPA
ncbi:MAG: phage late control D family protein [Haliangiales bacterium]